MRSLPPRIAVDLLGGDNAPAVVVDGVLRALAADPDLVLVLVGPRPASVEATSALGAAARERVRVIDVTDGVSMTDSVTRGADPRTSIGAAMRALADGEVDAVVSAGASGATVTAAVTAAGRLPGLRRPALAAILPGLRGPMILLDVGAGVRVDPVDLVQHAALGAAYARLVASVDTVRVGLLSIGGEAGKGDQLRRQADAALRAEHWENATYVGPVEGGDVITADRSDVVVTDGFTGNVLLKGAEAALAITADNAAAAGGPPRAAVLLGIAGTVVVCHGAATADDIESAVAFGGRLVRDSIVRRLAADLAHTGRSPGKDPQSSPPDPTRSDGRHPTKGD